MERSIIDNLINGTYDRIDKFRRLFLDNDFKEEDLLELFDKVIKKNSVNQIIRNNVVYSILLYQELPENSLFIDVLKGYYSICHTNDLWLINDSLESNFRYPPSRDRLLSVMSSGFKNCFIDNHGIRMWKGGNSWYTDTCYHGTFNLLEVFRERMRNGNLTYTPVEIFIPFGAIRNIKASIGLEFEMEYNIVYKGDEVVKYKSRLWRRC